MYPTEMLDASVVNRKGSSEFKSGNVSTGAVVNFSFLTVQTLLGFLYSIGIWCLYV